MHQSRESARHVSLYPRCDLKCLIGLIETHLDPWIELQDIMTYGGLQTSKKDCQSTRPGVPRVRAPPLPPPLPPTRVCMCSVA